MVNAQQPLLKDNGLGLQLDSLQEVTEFELDASDCCDATSNIFVHGTSDLKEHIDGLRVELERAVELVFFLCDVGLSDTCTDVSVLVLDLFYVRE